MKTNTHFLQTYRFEVEKRQRKVESLEAMISDFRQMVSNLDHQILAEQEKAGISDVNHFAYPTFAKAAIERRDNLITSVEDLESRLEMARVETQQAMDEMSKAEQVKMRDSKAPKPHLEGHQSPQRS